MTKSKKKSKGVALKVHIEDYDDQVECDANENLIESIVRAKSFIKIMRRINKRFRNNVCINVKDNQHQNSVGGNFQRRGKYGKKTKQGQWS